MSFSIISENLSGLIRFLIITIGLASQQKAAHSSASAVSAVLPAYCDPPNPCPLGYTSADGCIEGD